MAFVETGAGFKGDIRLAVAGNNATHAIGKAMPVLHGHIETFTASPYDASQL
jgi:hypothetical protein